MGEAHGKRTKRKGTCNVPSKLMEERSHEPCEVSTNPRVTADLEKVLVIPEFTATHDPMQLLRSPMGLGIGSIGGVAWTNRRKGSARMVDKVNNVLRSHGREEPRGRG